ncbi:hypothetical protein STTU_1696 [Streptomyces sp. Tu6071]|nr:hypothetical protein STTU_1696 [Streptomyces sp. Tu6071]
MAPKAAHGATPCTWRRLARHSVAAETTTPPRHTPPRRHPHPVTATPP